MTEPDGMPPDPSPSKPGEVGDRIKDLVAQASDPRPDHFLHGILVVSFWAKHGEDTPDLCDLLSTPVEQTGAQIRAVHVMTGQMVRNMDGDE